MELLDRPLIAGRHVLKPLSRFFHRYLARAALLSAALLPGGRPARAAEGTRAFDVPAGDALISLRQFSTQSREQLFYLADVVKGVTTTGIKGALTSEEALKQMLNGTGLVAKRDRKTGAFTISRSDDPNADRAAPSATRDRPEQNQIAPTTSPNMTSHPHPRAATRLFHTLAAFLGASVAGNGQTAAPAKTEKQEEVLKMNPFEVIMTQDRGYIAPNSGLALKTNEEIIKIPQSITVMTRDMLDDIAAESTSDALGYAGLSNFFQGDSASMRGVRVNMLVDGIGDPSFFDPVIVDSITIVRGPSAVLYGLNASLGGAVIKNTRVPTGRNSTLASVQVDQWGFLRTELDVDRSIAKVGDGKVAIRFDGLHQQGGWLKRTKNTRDVLYLMSQWKNPSTTLRFAVTATQHSHNPTRNIFLTPEGIPFSGAPGGADRREDFMPANTVLERRDQSYRLILLHGFSRNWNMSLRGSLGRNKQYQPIALIGTPDFSTREVSLYSRLNNLKQNNYAGSYDVNGQYRLFSLPMTTNIGFLVNDNANNPSSFNFHPQFGALNAGKGVGFHIRGTDEANLWIPMDNPQIEKIVVPPESSYRALTTSANPTTNPGSRNETIQTNAYVQQNVELFKDRLILVGSLAQFNYFNEGETIRVPTPTTITATIQRQHKLLHRLGLVYRITPEIGIYALDSQSMAPQTVRLIDGTITPPQAGKGHEIGLKVDLFGSRLTATIAAFDIKLTNVALLQPDLSPITGERYYALIGETKQRGADISLIAKPKPNLQLTFNAYKGTVKNQAGLEHLPSTFTGAVALYGRYSFTSDALKKFAVGGGANRQYGRWVSANMILPDGTRLPGSVARLKDGTNTQLFADYYVTRNLTLKLSVTNLFDDLFSVGFQNGQVVDPVLPRTVNFFAKYRF